MNFRLNTGFTVLAYTVLACYFTYTTLLRCGSSRSKCGGVEEYRMDPRNKHAQCFYGTLEECLERYGGKSQFTVSAPLTFFSGARLETHRRAESKDGQLVIVERQLGPTSCEVYRIAAKMPPQATGSAAAHSNCA